MHDEGKGVPASESKARDLYRRGVELGHVPSVTNLAIKVMEHDPGEAVDLFEQAAAASDGKAGALLQAITESGMARAVAGDLDDEDEDFDPAPSPVRVVPSGTWRPNALAAALREGTGAPSKEAEEITAFMLGFGRWRRLARTATKGKADRPDKECGAEEVERRRAYQAYVLTSCSDMGPVAACIAVEALQPMAKAGRPVLDSDTLARMRPRRASMPKPKAKKSSRTRTIWTTSRILPGRWATLWKWPASTRRLTRWTCSARSGACSRSSPTSGLG